MKKIKMIIQRDDDEIEKEFSDQMLMIKEIAYRVNNNEIENEEGNYNQN